MRNNSHRMCCLQSHEDTMQGFFFYVTLSSECFKQSNDSIIFIKLIFGYSLLYSEQQVNLSYKLVFIDKALKH